MEGSFKLKISKTSFSFIGFLVIGFLLAPFLFFFTQLPWLEWPKEVEWLEATGWTFVQAFLSTCFTLLFSLLGAQGLVGFSKKKYHFLIEALILIPCFLPHLILVISLVNFTELFFPFPFGLSSLILAQILTYTGFTTVALGRSLTNEASSLSAWAFVHGMKPFKFLAICSQTLLKKDIQILFITLFVCCWSSLSLPLLLSGGHSVSLEFYIYEQLKDVSLWPEAGSLILLQTLFVFCLCFLGFVKQKPSLKRHFTSPLFLISKPAFIFFPLIPTFLSFAGLFFLSDFQAFKRLLPLKPLLVEATLSSLILSLCVGFFTLFLLTSMALAFSNLKARRFVASYLNPGATLTGFAFLLFPFWIYKWTLLKWILGVGLLTFPFVYRFRGELLLQKLSQQIKWAQFLGANDFLIFREILWPQCRSTFFLCAGMSSFWAMGEFAYTSILSHGKWNIALVVQDLFSSYRLDLAVLASWLLLFLSFVTLLFWLGVDFVFDKKFILHRR